MSQSKTRFALFLTAILVVSMSPVTGSQQKACPNDSKLIGLKLISASDVPGTWWQMSKAAFESVGIFDYQSALEGISGKTYGSLAEAIDDLLEGVATFDKNGNNLVCAYEVRGDRGLHDPLFNILFFGISDDLHVK